MAEGDTGGTAETVEATVVLRNPGGLHARSGAAVVQMAARFDAHVQLHRKAQSANARSLLELLRLGARRGDDIRITAGGRDAAKAVAAISALVAEGPGDA